LIVFGWRIIIVCELGSVVVLKQKALAKRVYV